MNNADCSVSNLNGAATSASCGGKRERYCKQPRNRFTVFLLPGLGMFLIALTFAAWVRAETFSSQLVSHVRNF